jgi:DNA-directed RNA polymerase specialized sigma24 family protein
VGYYIKKEILMRVIKESRAQDQLTNEAVNIFLRMAKELSRVLKYKFEDDREDCIQEGLVSVLKYWRNFDINHPNCNPFAYFTQILKHGMAKGFKDLQRSGNKQMDKVEITDNLNV